MVAIWAAPMTLLVDGGADGGQDEQIVVIHEAVVAPTSFGHGRCPFT